MFIRTAWLVLRKDVAIEGAVFGELPKVAAVSPLTRPL